MSFDTFLEQAQNNGMVVVVFDEVKPAYFCVDYTGKTGQGKEPIAALVNYESKLRGPRLTLKSLFFEAACNHKDVLALTLNGEFYVCVDKKDRAIKASSRESALRSFMVTYSVWI